MKTNNGYRIMIALLLSCVIAGHGWAQENKGIRFETGSFAQILQKAKASGKYVFIAAGELAYSYALLAALIH